MRKRGSPAHRSRGIVMALIRRLMPPAMADRRLRLNLQENPTPWYSYDELPYRLGSRNHRMKRRHLRVVRRIDQHREVGR